MASMLEINYKEVNANVNVVLKETLKMNIILHKYVLVTQILENCIIQSHRLWIRVVHVYRN